MKWYGMLRIKNITEKQIVNEIGIYFHLMDKPRAFSKNRTDACWTGSFPIPYDQQNFGWMSFELQLGEQPEYMITYNRELLITALSMTDYLLLEGPRRRRAFWNNLAQEMAYFLVQPYLPEMPLIHTPSES